MTTGYVAGLARLGWLLDDLESALDSASGSLRVDSGFARANARARLPTDDEITAAIHALAFLGVLTPQADGWRLDREQWDAQASYRRGVRDALTFLAVQAPATEPVRLCVATPPGLSPATDAKLRLGALDLRAVIVDLIASAREELVLASPFWDDDTVAEIGPLLARRLDTGARVELLGRFGSRGVAVGPELTQLAMHPRCRLHGWYDLDPDDQFGSRTFHFKAVVADGGTRAYLGTANLTVSGLRSRMEIGTLLTGAVARQLAEMIRIVLSLARPVGLGQ